MNPDTQKALADILKVLADSVQAISDTTKQELPELVKEYMKWYIAVDWFWIVLWVAIVIIAWGFSFWFMHLDKKEKYNSDYATAAIVVRVISLALALIVWGNCAYELVQIYVAPRVFLFQKMMELIRGS